MVELCYKRKGHWKQILPLLWKKKEMKTGLFLLFFFLSLKTAEHLAALINDSKGSSSEKETHPVDKNLTFTSQASLPLWQKLSPVTRLPLFCHNMWLSVELIRERECGLVTQSHYGWTLMYHRDTDPCNCSMDTLLGMQSVQKRACTNMHVHALPTTVLCHTSQC